MPSHRALIKQLTKALGGTARHTTGVDFGRTYRDYRKSRSAGKRRTRVYFQPPFTRQRNTSRAFGEQLVGWLTEMSRYRPAVYKRDPYRGRPGRYTARRDKQRSRDRGGYY